MSLFENKANYKHTNIQTANNEYIRSNPLDKIVISKLLSKQTSKSNFKVDPFDKEEVNAILDATHHDPIRNLFQLAFFTGLRTLLIVPKEGLQQIWMAATKKDAETAFDNMLECFDSKYSKAMACLRKDRNELLAFYNFPAEHWVHIRTTNPIESTFATVRLRSKRSKNCGSRETTLTMVFKLMVCSEKRWRKFKGFGKTVSSNLTHLRQWLPWVGGSYDSSDAESFIIQSREKFSNDAGADYAVIYNETIIGMVGIHSIDWENGCASIGYWMGSSHCGRGITTLVMKQLLAYLFDDLLLQKIVLTAAEHNIASNKVAIKLGMEQEGLSIGHECLHGEHVDHILYQIETTHQLDLKHCRK